LTTPAFSPNKIEKKKARGNHKPKHGVRRERRNKEKLKMLQKVVEDKGNYSESSLSTKTIGAV
jgi:hypothetical protein